MKISNKKGITLVALIITIIVMLILLSVTVTVSLNGEMFKNARDATKNTQIAADAKMLLSLVLEHVKTDGIVDFESLESEVESKRIYKVRRENIY